MNKGLVFLLLLALLTLPTLHQDVPKDAENGGKSGDGLDDTTDSTSAPPEVDGLDLQES